MVGAITHNFFQTNPPHSDRGVWIPEVLPAEIFSGVQFLSGLSATDLREMSKFEELPNVEGLAVHPTKYPRIASNSDGSPFQYPGLEVLRGDYLKLIAATLRSEPLIVISGALGGALEKPFVVQALIPQSSAHLAAGLQALLWPQPHDLPAPPDYTLLWIPPVIKDRAGRVHPLLDDTYSNRHAGVVVGRDEMASTAQALRVAWHRWRLGVETHDPLLKAALRKMYLPRRIDPSEGSEDIQIVDVDPQRDAAVYSRNDWPAMSDAICIDEGLPRGEERAASLFANAIFDMRELILAPLWRRAALSVGALHFSAVTDGEGRFPFFHWDETELESAANAALLETLLKSRCSIIIPRQAIPYPYLNEARRWRVVDRRG